MYTSDDFHVAAFCLDESPYFVGYGMDRESWNGFACPMFTYRESVRVLDYVTRNDSGLYTFDGDTFRVWFDRWGMDGNACEVYPAHTITLWNGETRRVWGIGAGGWVWSWWDHFGPIIDSSVDDFRRMVTNTL